MPEISVTILLSGEPHKSNMKKCLKINKEKCIFCVDQITFSGHTLTSYVVVPDRKKIDAINNIKCPTNTSQVKTFPEHSKLLPSIYCQLANNNETFEKALKKESDIHTRKRKTRFSDTKSKINFC